MTHHLPFMLLTSVLGVHAQDTPRAIIINEPSEPIVYPSYHRVNPKGVKLHLVKFDSRHYQLSIIDQKNGPATEWVDAASLGRDQNALAVINGGFFTAKGAPLGMVITSGIQRGANNLSSLGSGFYFANKAHAGIARRSTINEVIRVAKPSQLIQSGPMLYYQGHAVKGLSTEKSRPRSFVATDGAFQWLIGYAETATLAQLGDALGNKALAGVNIYHAMNLDGGRSSDFWISQSVTNGNKTFKAFWNKPVRNFLILEKK